MHLDVVDLRNFYYRTRLGRAAQAAIRARVGEFWGDTKGQTVAGFGFAVPLLRPHLEIARRVIAMMPAEQGVMPWPPGMPNLSVMVQETAWPLETGHVDRLVLMHGLETSENPSALLDECWRVLGPGGRALFVVPNRSGLWARGDTTPFGFGRPYTTGQLEAQLKLHNFIPEGHASALFQPPSHRRFWLRLGPMMEKFGRRTAGSLVGGVHIVEATKRTHAPSRPGLAEAVKRPLGAIEALGKPGTSPARQVPEGGET